MSSRNLVCCFILLSACSLFAQIEKTVTVTIPKAGVLGGRMVPEGAYNIEIDQAAEKPYLRLVLKGKLIATDVAIVLPARGSSNTAAARVIKIGKKEFIRIQVREQDKWYFVYLIVKP